MINWIYSQKEFTFFGALFIAIILTLIFWQGFSFVINQWMIERVDSEIRAEFIAKKFTFTANQDILLNSKKFQSLQVDNFSNITLYPLPAEENDPNFESVADTPKMVITPEDNEDSATFQVKNVNDEHCGQNVLPTITFPTGSEEQLYEYFLSVTSFMQKLKQKPCGKLNRFIIHKGSTITLEADPTNKGEFNVLIEKGESEAEFAPVLVSFEEAFQLNSELSQIVLGDAQLSTEEGDLKLILDEDEDPDITIIGKPDKLELRLSVFPTERFDIFSDANIPIATPKIFTTDDTITGQIESKTTLLSEGTISFTEYPEIEPLSFKESDLIRFGEGGNFKVEQVKFIPAENGKGGIEIRLRGTPTKLTINETFKVKHDRRLTYYETLEQDKFWQIAFDYVLWAIPFLISIMGLILIDRVKVIGK